MTWAVIRFAAVVYVVHSLLIAVPIVCVVSCFVCVGHFDLRRIGGQTSLLKSVRKINKVVTVIYRLILTAHAIDVTQFHIDM